MMIAMTNENHGVHLAYSEDEARRAQEHGWKRDMVLTKQLAQPQPAVDEPPAGPDLIAQYVEKFGKPPHHRMTTKTIEAALAE